MYCLTIALKKVSSVIQNMNEKLYGYKIHFLEVRLIVFQDYYHDTYLSSDIHYTNT